MFYIFFVIECNYRARVINAKDDGIESLINRKIKFHFNYRFNMVCDIVNARYLFITTIIFDCELSRSNIALSKTAITVEGIFEFIIFFL